MMYKNIIFDLGNVLLDFKPEEYLKIKIKETNKVSEINKLIFQSKYWAMLDRGTLTEEEAVNILINSSRENEKLIRLAFENWYEILQPIKGSVEILKELKKAGYCVYFLSNFQLLAFDYVTEKYDFFKLFDGGVISFKEKLLKPEDGIYQKIIDDFKIKPEESIFIDDTRVNIEGAKKHKFEAILFKSPEKLKEELKNYKIFI